MRTSTGIVVAIALSIAVAPLRAGEDEEAPTKGPKELAGLKYRLVGPPAGGRVSRSSHTAFIPQSAHTRAAIIATSRL